MVPYDQKLSKMVDNGPKCLKMVKNGKKSSRKGAKHEVKRPEGPPARSLLIKDNLLSC